MRLYCICLVLFALIGPAYCQEYVSKEEGGIVWYEVGQLGVEGQGFSDTVSRYDRLPGRAQGKVREAVWSLSRHSAGLCVRFVTDATSIDVRWELTSDRLSMPHMPATGVSGLDVYARDTEGNWRWLACAQPKSEGTTQAASIVRGLRGDSREYLVYFPLYNGVTSVEVGVPRGSIIEDAPDYAPVKAKPIVFYGTSITHGACASRPGMVHTAILGRHFERPVINLGFSGNGKMEPEVVQFLQEIDAACFVIDCCPNLTGEETARRTGPLVRQIRASHPATPILLVEDRRYADAWLVESKSKRNDENHVALRAAYDELTEAGVPNLFYLSGDDLLGSDGEGTVDSSHPNDLGFLRQADAFSKILSSILEK